MGQGKSHINNRPLFDQKQFEALSSINDERYGSMRPLIHNETKISYAAISRTIQTEEEFSQYVGEVEARLKLSQHPNLVQLVNYNALKSEEFCSTFYTVNLMFEYLPHNLQAELAERRKFVAAYREGEIWYILDALISAASFLQQANVCHGDIRPYNLQLTQNGEIKLGEVFKHKNSRNSYHQLMNKEHEEFYISPQYFQATSQYKGIPNVDQFKSEVYSIGMTALEAATLENVSQLCYNHETFTIQSDQVNTLLNRVRSQYSFQLYDFLSHLLEENEETRKTPIDFLAELNQPFVLSQKTHNLSLIELFSQRNYQQVNENQEQQQEEVEKVVRSAKPQEPYLYEQSSIPPITSTDDLNARIQAVIALSRDTIAKYGAPSQQTSAISNSNIYTSNSYNQYTTPQATTNVYTSSQYVAPVATQSQYPSYNNDSRASQVQTKTYLNENTNAIETKTYYSPSIPTYQEPIEEVIKRSTRGYNNTTSGSQVVPAIRQSQVVQPYVEEKLSNNNNNNYSSYTNYALPSNQNYYSSLTNPVANQVPVTSSNYYSPAPLGNFNYTSTATTNVSPITNFQSNEERDAYINRIISETKKSNAFISQSQVQSLPQQVNTQITYTNNY